MYCYAQNLTYSLTDVSLAHVSSASRISNHDSLHITYLGRNPVASKALVPSCECWIGTRGERVAHGVPCKSAGLHYAVLLAHPGAREIRRQSPALLETGVVGALLGVFELCSKHVLPLCCKVLYDWCYAMASSNRCVEIGAAKHQLFNIALHLPAIVFIFYCSIPYAHTHSRAAEYSRARPHGTV